MMTEDVKADGKIVVRVDEELEEIIPGFLENRRKDIKKLHEALNHEDYETIRILGHSMKGAGGGYGFDKISDIGRSLENSATEKDAEKIKEQTRELLYFIDHVKVLYE